MPSTGLYRTGIWSKEQKDGFKQSLPSTLNFIVHSLARKLFNWMVISKYNFGIFVLQYLHSTCIFWMYWHPLWKESSLATKWSLNGTFFLWKSQFGIKDVFPFWVKTQMALTSCSHEGKRVCYKTNFFFFGVGGILIWTNRNLTNYLDLGILFFLNCFACFEGWILLLVNRAGSRLNILPLFHRNQWDFHCRMSAEYTMKLCAVVYRSAVWIGMENFYWVNRFFVGVRPLFTPHIIYLNGRDQNIKYELPFCWEY